MSGPVSAWTCPICGERYVVPSRARDCEARCREIVWVQTRPENIQPTGYLGFSYGTREAK